MKTKKTLAVFTIITFLFSILIINVEAASNLKICGVDIGIAAGTHMQFSNADGSNSESGYYYKGKYLAASQCFGFARWVQYKLFGTTDYTSGDFYKVKVDGSTSIAKGSLTTANLKKFIQASKPGAHIRTFKNDSGTAHSLIITAITDSGFSIAQANGSNNNEYSGYKQNYVGTYTYTWSSYVNSTYGARGIDYIKLPNNYPFSSIPAIPAIKSHSDVTSTSVTLSWNAVSGATKYKLEYRKAGEDWKDAKTKNNITGTSYDLTGLDSGKLYWIRLYAGNDSGWSDNSKSHGVYLKPNAPTTSTNTTNSIKVNWDNGGGKTRYELLARKSGEEDYKTVANLTNTYTYTVTGLTAGAEYYFKIVAHNLEDTSVVSIRSDSGHGYTKPNGPTVTGVTPNSVSLSWNKDAMDGAYSYAYGIYRRISGTSSYTWVTGTSNKSYTDTGLQPNTAYDYYIDVFRTKDGNTEYCVTSEAITVTTNAQDPTGIGLNTNNINLTQGESYKLYATVYPDTANDRNAYWYSYDVNVATVAWDGTVTAVNPGTTTICANTSNGIVTSCNVTVVPKYTFVDLGENFIAYIKYAQNMKYVTQDEDSNVTVRSYNGENNQVWNFIRLGDGSYFIRSVNNCKQLDVYGWGTESGTNVTACNDSSDYSANQRWNIIESNGKYILKPLCSDCMLDVYGGGDAADGTNVQTWEANNSSSQEFYINIINDTESPTISNLKITNSSSSSFTIECDFNDNMGVKDLWIHILGRGRNPSVWVPVTNGSFSYTVQTEDYYGQGSYYVRLYVYDYSGNYGFDCTDAFNAIYEESVRVGRTKVYNGHIYQSCYIPGITWNGARTNAYRLGGYPVSISDAEENDFIKNNLAFRNYNLFIGLNDVWDEGNYSWFTGEDVTYTNWAAGEPKSTSDDEDGVYIAPNGEWLNCNADTAFDNIGFIVEYEPQVETEFEYNGHRYIVFNIAPGWDAAKKYCEFLGGHLATVTTEGENNAIDSHTNREKYYWLGGTDSENEGEWKWITGEPFSYTNWFEGEPNDDNDQDFIQMWDGQWDDGGYSIYGNNKGFVCEFDSPMHPIPIVTNKKEGALWNFSVKTINCNDKSDVYLAIYDRQDILISIKKEKLKPDDVNSFSISEIPNAAYYKVFVVNDNIEPICYSYTAELN